MLVMKFGGTSLGSGERILKAADLVAAEKNRRPVVVVSAMSQVTNVLVDLTDGVMNGDNAAAVADGIKKLRDSHHNAARALKLEPDVEMSLLAIIDSLITKLEATLDNTVSLGELTAHAHDQIISFGERLTIHLLAAALQKRGLAAVALEASELIVTDDGFGHASPLLAESRKQMQTKLTKLIDDKVVPVITGFMGATVDGIVTTLGRGGSDYSATIIGYCLDADEVWIWTDVDGVMTADPRIVEGAHTIEELSYDEAAELSYFGARVLHPRTMVPATLNNMPIRIKNTLQPDVAGTKITSLASIHPDGAKAMTVLRHLSLITVQGKGMQGVFGVAAKVFGSLAEHKVNVLFISQASSENNISIVVEGSEGGRAVKVLNSVFQPELKTKNMESVQAEPQVAIIAVVGEGMRSHTGIAGRIFSAVGHAKINVIAIAQGSSERNISFIVKEDQATSALQTIHDELHLEKNQQQAGK